MGVCQGANNTFFSFDGEGSKELFEIILTGIIKEFSNNPHVFFAAASVFYLTFNLKSLKYITDDIKFHNSWSCLLIMFLFVLPRDIITVQNPRYSVAMWLAVYGTLRFFYNKKNRLLSVLLIFLSPAFHSGLWFFVIVFIIGLIVSKNTKATYYFYCISIPLVFLSVDVISMVDISSLPLPSNLKIWASWHFNKDTYETAILGKGSSGFFWVSKFFNILSRFVYVIMPIILYKNKEEIMRKQDGTKELFYFSLFYFAITNCIQSVPVLGGRAYFVTRILSILLWFKIMFPKKGNFLILLLFSCSWEIFYRYFYHGAVYTSVPNNIFYSSLPQLISDFWGVSSSDVLQLF